MRVYVPDKNENVINEVLKDLYMLKKAIDYGTGTADGRIAMVDSIRAILNGVLNKASQENSA